MWIDIHAHLYDNPPHELAVLLDEARECDVGTVVNAATSIKSSAVVVSQCGTHDLLCGTVGVSPLNVEELRGSWDDLLASHCRSKDIIGVGEIGLDGSNPRYPAMELQIPALERQLNLAVSLDLPVVLHSRGAEPELLDRCRKAGVTRAVFHCYTGDRQTLRAIIDAGYSVSFSGIVTFKSVGLDALVSYVPLDRLFVETDTPYLSPSPFRGKPNAPSRVPLVGKRVAEIRRLPATRVAEAIRENFVSLFRTVPFAGADATSRPAT